MDRANISITILVLGVLALCALALLSFYISNNLSQDRFASTSLINDVKKTAEKIKFYEKTKLNPEEASNPSPEFIEEAFIGGSLPYHKINYDPKTKIIKAVYFMDPVFGEKDEKLFIEYDLNG